MLRFLNLTLLFILIQKVLFANKSHYFEHKLASNTTQGNLQNGTQSSRIW